jgi:hypothetical protein
VFWNNIDVDICLTYSSETIDEQKEIANVVAYALKENGTIEGEDTAENSDENDGDDMEIDGSPTGQDFTPTRQNQV